MTIATYHSYTVKEAGKNKTIGQFEVVGKGWDETSEALTSTLDLLSCWQTASTTFGLKRRALRKEIECRAIFSP